MAPKLSGILPQRLPEGFSRRLGTAAGRSGLTPNMLSVAGFLGNAAAAWLITREDLLFAGIVFLAFSLADTVDGAVARATGRATPFGAVLDAVFDRASEALVLCACVWYFAERGEQVQVATTFAAIMGSIGVSYMRARAEVAGFAMREGLFRRQERVALLTIGLLAGGLTVAITVLAVLSNVTALQRFAILARGLRRLDAEERGA